MFSHNDLYNDNLLRLNDNKDNNNEEKKDLFEQYVLVDYEFTGFAYEGMDLVILIISNFMNS